MRILIADDSVAGSKALRPLFRHGIAAKGAKKPAARRGAPAAGQVVISLAPTRGKVPAKSKSIRGRAAREECACTHLDLGDQPELAANILDSMGLALLNRGCLKEGGPLIEQALTLRRNFFGDNHPATAASQISSSRLLREVGDYRNAEQAARDSLRINEAVYGAEGMPVAASLNALGVVQLAQGRFDAAQQSAVRGLQILAGLDPLQTDPNVARLMDVQGRAQTALGDLEGAAKTYEELLALDLKQLGTKNHPRYATHVGNLAAVKDAARNFKGAIKDYETAIKLFNASLNTPCQPNLIDSYANLGSLLRERGKARDLVQAGEYFATALRLDSQVRGASHVLLANDYANLARLQYDSQGKKNEALKNFTMAVQVYERNVKEQKFPAEHYFLAEARTWQGRIMVETNNVGAAKQAEPILRGAIATWPVQLGPNSSGEAIAKACLGHSLFLQTKSLPEAKRLLTEAVAIIRKEVPANNPLVAQVEGWLKQV